MTETYKKKLIEVALPLEAINRESAREKSIRHGHPSTLHLWWARRPLAACRAVIFAQLVDDPSENPDSFPTEAQQAKERTRLFNIIERLVDWDNISDTQLYREALDEITRSSNGVLPSVCDPFAGGGSIPLESQRLGLTSYASDLNPVAVLINKAMIEFPALWNGSAPVWPFARDTQVTSWQGSQGLAEDVRKYGKQLKEFVEAKLSKEYPYVTLPSGTKTNVIAWFWARTVTCPNPACGIAMPLIRSFWLAKKPNRSRWLKPSVENGEVKYSIEEDPIGPKIESTIGRNGGVCIGCNSGVPLTYIREQGKEIGLQHSLMAIAVQGDRERIYCLPDEIHVNAADVAVVTDAPAADLPTNPRDFKTPNYGLNTFSELFTNRQLLFLTTFSKEMSNVREQIFEDSKKAGLTDELSAEYANNVLVYLAFVTSRALDYNNALCSWHPTGEKINHLFTRQAIPMVWDFVETNPFSNSSGNWLGQLEWIAKVIDQLPAAPLGFVSQRNATQLTLEENSVVSTDPPYYDNIGYADLSDFFYIWLRKSLLEYYPELLATLQTPKSDELIATPYRFGGSKQAAEKHFEDGFVETFSRIADSHTKEYPITIFYAFKQVEDKGDSGVASTGWETMLNGLMTAGLSITATWPIRTELGNRLIASGTNALASSIVLVCRHRSASATATDRRGFLQELNQELPKALRELQQGSIAPVDLAQASIGPGMAVFSRHSRVIESDGTDMSVRTALVLINQVLGEVLSQQEGDFDSDTRFCIKWFEQYEWSNGLYGEAEVLARAMNTAVDALARGGVIQIGGGKTTLISPELLPDHWDPESDERISEWEVLMHLVKTMSMHGQEQAAKLLKVASSRVNAETVKELAYQLYGICEKKNWSKSGQLFNGIGASWNDVAMAATRANILDSPSQTALSFDE